LDYSIQVKNPLYFEGGLLYEIALHDELDYFITSNTKDFKNSKLNVAGGQCKSI
jgi:hypothetical protein